MDGEDISIHAPRVGGDQFQVAVRVLGQISIHAPRVGGDDHQERGGGPDHISIHAPRVGGDGLFPLMAHLERISIHAPRVGGDTRRAARRCGRSDFNPRPPCGGRPLSTLRGAGLSPNFNPRPPCGGRLSDIHPQGWRSQFQSTPPVWGATGSIGLPGLSNFISIHAPRVGGDPAIFPVFLDPHISIHAPRVGGDRGRDTLRRIRRYFNPRPPCGGRRVILGQLCGLVLFQSTPPVWGATGGQGGRFTPRMPISIHAPRVGGD